MMESFKVTRVFADTNGNSRFEELFYPLTDGGGMGFLSDKIAVAELSFRKVAPSYNDLHRAPARQFVVLLDGSIEIETSLGEKRIFQVGEILLMEDTVGKGHRTKNVLAAVRSSLFITLSENL